MGRLGTWLAMFVGLLVGAGAVSYGLPVQSNASSQDCNIKGNINPTTGARIYHMPGQQFYSKTTIDPRFGERLFCSEEEASTAGWRKARR